MNINCMYLQYSLCGFDQVKKKYVSFDEPLEGLVKKAWSTKAAKHYSDTLSTWRDTWKEKGKKPQCVSLDTWNKWLQKWNSPQFKKKSDTASKNRRTEVAGEGSGPSRHTRGSRTFIEHAEDLAILLGRLANDFELFKHTHGNRKKKNGDGDYVDKRSTDVALLVEELVADATAAGKQIDMSQLYMQVVQAVGGVKKQRVYGLGSNLSSSQIPSSSIPKSHEEVERIRAEACEEGRAEAQTELRTQMEEMSKKQEEFNKKLHLLMQHIGQGSETLSPPTNDEYHTEDDEDLGGD